MKKDVKLLYGEYKDTAFPSEKVELIIKKVRAIANAAMEGTIFCQYRFIEGPSRYKNYVVSNLPKRVFLEELACIQPYQLMNLKNGVVMFYLPYFVFPIVLVYDTNTDICTISLKPVAPVQLTTFSDTTEYVLCSDITPDADGPATLIRDVTSVRLYGDKVHFVSKPFATSKMLVSLDPQHFRKLLMQASNNLEESNHTYRSKIGFCADKDLVEKLLRGVTNGSIDPFYLIPFFNCKSTLELEFQRYFDLEEEKNLTSTLESNAALALEMPENSAIRRNSVFNNQSGDSQGPKTIDINNKHMNIF